MQHGLGYALGREDGSHVRTADVGSSPDENRMGWYRFAEAYAQGWDDYNYQRRHYMVNCRDAYNTWQKTNGETIFAREATSNGDKSA